MITQNFKLQSYNTFGIAAKAAKFAKITAPSQLKTLLNKLGETPQLVLGGGSNILLTKDIKGWVAHNAIHFIEVESQQNEEVIIKVGGGVNWHELVLWTLKKGFGGLENMALIPGTVGAAPIQNIGAYGVELKDRFVSLEAFEWDSQKSYNFDLKDCQFAYRDSFFKQAANRGKYFITAVRFRLSTKNHNLNTNYGAIQQKLDALQISQPKPSDIAAAVIAIRRSKLPDYVKIGNGGSFFKNPIVSKTKVASLLATYPTAPHYDLPNEQVKIPAGWLIEQCGWKGQQEGNVGCFKNQALVLINLGGATGQEVFDFSQKILESVDNQFGIKIEREINVI